MFQQFRRCWNRERKLNPNFFFSNFSGTPGISRQNPGISRQKSLISPVSRGIPNFLAPTPSCGRTLPHRKISGLKSLGLGSFFVPDGKFFPDFPAARNAILRRFRHFPARQMAPGKLTPPSGTLLDFLLLGGS